jgi:hypothetical protein
MRAVRRALAIVLTFGTAALAQTGPAQQPPAAPPAAPGAPPAAPAAAPAAQPAAPPAIPTTTTPPPPAAGEPSAPPAAAEPDLAGLLGDQRDALGRRCDFKAAYPAGDLRYVACGDAGVWIVRARANAAPLVLERRDMDGQALGFFVQDGHVWVKVASVQARQLVRVGAGGAAAGQYPAAPAPAPSPAPAAAAPAPPLASEFDRERPPRDGKVLEVAGGYVVIDLGSGAAVDDGDHIAFYEPIEDQLGGGIISQREELAAVGVVDGVAVHRSRVRLGLNERVSMNARARLTGDPLTAGVIAPRRASDVWEVAFIARPFLVLDNLGAGVFADLRAGYRTDYNVHYEALVLPVAFATAEQGATTPAAAVLAASYDARLFEVGLGIGGQTVNDTAFDLEPGTGLTAFQRVRLGASDGLHLEGLFYMALFHSEFEFSSVRVQGQIPMSGGTWLVATGGGGSLGIGHGELGLRMLLDGNGDRGSFFLTTRIGFVHVFETPSCIDDPFAVCEEIDYSGPMVGVGGEWRL